MSQVLLLEDDLTLAMHYRESLEEAGLTVFHEVNVEAAKLTVQEEQIDVAVCDILIRGISGEPMVNGGISLIAFIKLNVDPKPKIVAITGSNPSLRLVQHAESMNLDAVIQKPVDLAHLVSEVVRLVPETSG